MQRHRKMKTDILFNLRTYWESLRKGRVAPYRAELDPRKFEDALEHMFILEQLNPSQLRVRLAGMALCEMMGMEVRGMPPEAFMEAAHRAQFTQHINAVLSDPSVVELDLKGTGTDGKETEAQMLLLPLRSDFGEVTRVLGCIVTKDRAMKAPVNFSISGVRSRAIRADGTTEAVGDVMPGFSEDQPTYSPPVTGSKPVLRSVEGNPGAERSTPRRGHLRVVSSKD